MANLEENHSIIVENREKISVTGVTNVEEFDENSVNLNTTKGGLVIKGENLHIEKLNLDSYELEVTGIIYSFDYIDTYNKGSFFGRLFK